MMSTGRCKLLPTKKCKNPLIHKLHIFRSTIVASCFTMAKARGGGINAGTMVTNASS
jgi:hypothetical protein